MRLRARPPLADERVHARRLPETSRSQPAARRRAGVSGARTSAQSGPRRLARLSLLFAGLLLALALPCVTRAAELPEGFSEVRVARGIDPTALAVAPDGRVFVAVKSGQVRVIKDDMLLATPFASVQTDNYNEQGLIGITLDPSFAQNGHVYVIYTTTGSDRHNRVSRFTASGDVASGAETVLYDLDKRNSGIHNGGGIAFGPDGKLYVGAGDDGNGNAAQQYTSTHGKILRLNADGSVPSDNPRSDLAAPGNAIWARGLRNPFMLTFQPGTGRLFINEVGGGAWEEINEGAADANYGWPAIEGRRGGLKEPENYRDPLHAYPHSEGCAITGGAFYNPSRNNFPSSYVGRYLFSDYCSGYIKVFDPSSRSVTNFATKVKRPVGIRVAGDGSLYYLARSGVDGGSVEDNTSSSDGEVYRVRYTGSLAPSISAEPEDQTVSAGQTATFVVAASGAAPLRYQWQRDGSDISGATSARYTTRPVQAFDSGARFSVVVRNDEGSVMSRAAVLSVGASNGAPAPTISVPAVGTKYRAGEPLRFRGSATDPEDGNLPASGLSWWIDFHHDTHTHPGLPQTDGIFEGAYDIPRTIETSANVFYRIYLRATDARGRSTTVTRDVYPETSTFTLATDPPGLGVLLDDRPMVTPITITGVVGVTRTLDVPAAQNMNGKTYVFSKWSDAGAKRHTFNTTPAVQTYTATFTESTGPSPEATLTGLVGSYFNNVTLAGSPVLVRREAVDFAFGDGSPDASVLGADAFSARWTGEVLAPVSGSYVFSTVSDDGVRLWVDGKLIIDRFDDHPRRTDSASPLTLEAGKRYAIKLEYYERGGVAEARLHWSYPGVTSQPIPRTQLSSPAGNGLEATYYKGDAPAGLPLLSRVEAIDFDWKTDSPAPGKVDADNFSVRWEGELEAPETGNYVFSTVSDDAIRVWLDGRLLIDNYVDHGRTIDLAPAVSLRAGQRYAVRVEYRERGGNAEVRLRYALDGGAASAVPASLLFLPPASGLRGAYFANPTLTGLPVLQRVEAVDFDWSAGSPAPGTLAADHFGVRWTGEVEAPVSGNYVFSTVSDDGVRLWVNGRLVIDRWVPHPRITDDAPAIALTAGERVPVRLEFFEHSGLAEARLWWSYPGNTRSPVPDAQLAPTASETY